MRNEQFTRYDTRQADGVYITFRVEKPEDQFSEAPDKNDDGFWPSRDKNAAGYVEPAKFAEEQRKAEERMKDWRDGVWAYVGIRVRAEIDIVRNGSGQSFELASAGLWGVESDADADYLASIAMDEVLDLISNLDALGTNGLTRHYRVKR